MHELSIAMSIVELAEEEAQRRGSPQVTAVHLQLGALSGVVKDALLSCYDIACEGTRLQNSRLVVEEVPVVIFCDRCRAERPVESAQSFCCAECKAPALAVLRGKEIQVVALEIEECVPNPA